MMNPANLQQWILHPETLNKETLYELRTSLVRYPYCQTLRLLYLKNLYLLHDINFGSELRKSTLFITDRKVLFYLIEGDKYTLSAKSKKTEEAEEIQTASGGDRTISLIDAFLSSIPEEMISPAELDYVTDYTAFLQNREETGENTEVAEEQPRMRGHDLIDDFIEKAEESAIKLQPVEEENPAYNVSPELENPEEDEEDTFFTETLARIYIKQKRYSKALEIIKKLSLKYPKKNSYFADQIRFLEKLIINANSK